MFIVLILLNILFLYRFSTQRVDMLHDTINIDNGFNYGDEFSFFCPSNKYAAGFVQRVSDYEVFYKDWDKTGLNELMFICDNLEGDQSDDVHKDGIRYGSWKKRNKCPVNSFLIGYELVSQKSSYFGDDVAAYGFNGLCSDATKPYLYLEGSGSYLNPTNVTTSVKCPEGTVLCGLIQKIDNREMGILKDVSGLNNLRGYCCIVCIESQSLFLDIEDKTCKKCHFNCKTCSGPGNKECLSCYLGDKFESGSCTTSQPIFLWPDNNLVWNSGGQSLNKWNCGIFQSLFGGLKINEMTLLLENIPPHYKYRTILRLIKVDTQPNEKLLIKIDDQSLNQISFQNYDSLFYGNQCDDINFRESRVVLEFENFHEQNFLKLVLTAVDLLPKKIGLENFFIGFYKCPQICASCDYQICKSCIDNADLVDGYCVCRDGYYLKEVENCLQSICYTCSPCVQGCATCFGGTTNDCNTCLQDYFMYCISSCEKICPSPFWGYKGLCITECPSGPFFLNNNARICQSCDPSCATCIESSAVDCLECNSLEFHEFDVGIKGRCLKACDSPKFGDTTKNRCVDSCSPTLWKDIDNKKCLSECLPSQYKSEVDNTCYKCHANCLTCFGPNEDNCLSCPPNIPNLIKNKCLSKCVDGSFYSTAIEGCQPCESPCKSCEPIDGGNLCLTCSQDFLNPISKSCTTSCPAEYPFPDIGEKLCRSCEVPGCLQCCSSFDDCEKCDSNHFLPIYSSGVCIPDCNLIGEYGDINERKCKKCSDNCQACVETEFKCTSCKENLYLNTHSNFCGEQCEVGEFGDQDHVCKPCDINCATCKGTALFCLSCKKGKFLDPCSNKCVDSCVEPYFGLESLNECVLECPQDFKFEDIKLRMCKACDTICATCINTVTCTSCLSPLFLDKSQGRCINECPKGLWGVSGNRTCENSCGPDEFGDVNNRRICMKCSSYCLTCEDTKEKCLSCPQGQYLVNNVCFTECPKPLYRFDEKKICVEPCPTYYYESSDQNTCKRCPEGCLFCTNEQGNPCFCCEDNYFLFNNIQCLKTCPDNFYENICTSICNECDSSCKKCFGPCLDECNSCVEGFYLYENSCLTICPNAFYEDASTSTCQKCDETCAHCENNSTNCIKCSGSRFLYQAQCLTGCPSKYYPEANNNLCLSCDPSCETCNGPTLNNCSTCLVTNFILNNTCLKSCPISYFERLSDFKCVECDLICAGCENSATNCVNCSGDRFFYSNKCLSSCPTKFYANICNNVCDACNSACEKCFGPSINECLACASGFYLYEQSCLKICPYAFYEDTDNSKCQNCDITCANCEGWQTNCIKCSGDRFLYLNLCLISCPMGFYDNICNNTCDSCHSACKKCFGPSTDECLICASGFYLHEKSCLQVCPYAFYEDALNSKCQNCEITCADCEGSQTNCINCSGDRFLYKNNCLLSCPIKFYGNICNNVCESCNSACEKCFGHTTDECLTCSSGFYLYEKSCLGVCPYGYYEDTVNSKCLNCDSTCADCEGIQTNCIKCSGNRYLYKNECLVDCPKNFYNEISNNTCSNCNVHCDICYGPTINECSICKASYYLYQKSCLQICPLAYFEDVKNGVCSNCDITCTDCENSEANCVKCSGKRFLYNNTCLLDCPEHFYEESLNNTCNKCNSSCRTCYGPKINECNSCISPFYLEGSTCQTFCSVGRYKNDTNQVCDKCHDTCKSCNASLETSCISCNINSYFLGWNSTCLKTCPSGLYADPESLVCIKKCHYTCKDLECAAFNQSMCRNCTEKRVFFVEGQDENKTDYGSCKCINGTYGLDNITTNTNPVCTDCHSNCKTCDGKNINNCLTCQNFLAFNITSRTCDCPQGYESNGKCEGCHPNCFTCFGGSENQCKTCLQPRNISEGKCICPPGNVILFGICTSCDPTCKTCNGTESTDCMECADNRTMVDNQCQCNPFLVEIDSRCEKMNKTDGCIMGCKICNEPDTCLECKDISNTIDRKCTCKQGFYIDADGCKECHFSCGECSGGGPWNCRSVCSSKTRGNSSSGPVQGECACKEGFEEIYEKECKEKETVKVVMETIQSVTTKTAGATSSATSIMGSAGGGGIAILGILEISQLMSLAENMKIEFPLSLEKSYLFSMSSMRLDKFFPQDPSFNSSMNTSSQESSKPISGGGVRNVVFTLGLDVLAIFPILIVTIIYGLTKNFSLQKFLSKLLAVIRWRLLFSVFRLTSVAQLFFIFSELKFNTQDSFIGFSGFTWAVTLLILQILHFLFVLWTLNFRDFEDEAINEKYSFLIEGVESFFLLKKNFAVFSILRKILICIVFSVMPNQTAVLTILAIFFQTIYLLYIIFIKPLTSRVHLLILIIIESLLLLYFIILAILVRNEDRDARITIGWVLVVIIILTQLFMFVVALVNFVMTVRRIFLRNDDKYSNEAKNKNFFGTGINTFGKEKRKTIEPKYFQNTLPGEKGAFYKAETKQIELPQYKTFVLKDESSDDHLKDSNEKESSESARENHSQRKSLINTLTSRKSIYDRESENPRKSRGSYLKPSNQNDLERKPTVDSLKKEYKKRASQFSKSTQEGLNPKSAEGEDFISKLIIEEKRNQQNKQEIDSFHKKIQMAEISDPLDEQEDEREYPCGAILTKATVIKSKKGSFYLEEGSPVVVIKVVYEVSIAEISCKDGAGIVDLDCIAFQDD